MTAFDGKPDGVVADRSSTADLELEPVADVRGRSTPQFLFRHLPGCLAIEIDVKASSHADVTGEECGRPLDDPSVVDEVEPLEQTVVGNLALQLLQRPPAFPGRHLEPVRQCSTEGRRSRVTITRTHVVARAVRSTCVRASSIHRSVSGSPVMSRNQRSRCKSVSLSQSESGRVWREAVRERARVVVDGADGVGDQASHRFRVLMIPEKVRSNARGSSDREAPETGPFSVLEWPNVNADVRDGGSDGAWRA